MNEGELLKGLAEPTRLRIVMLLWGGSLRVCDLVAVLEMPQSTVSRHLARLKAASIVEDRRERKWVHYRLAEDELLDRLSVFFDRLRQVDPYFRDSGRLRQHLDERRSRER